MVWREWHWDWRELVTLVSVTANHGRRLSQVPWCLPHTILREHTLIILIGKGVTIPYSSTLRIPLLRNQPLQWDGIKSWKTTWQLVPTKLASRASPNRKEASKESTAAFVTPEVPTNHEGSTRCLPFVGVRFVQSGKGKVSGWISAGSSFIMCGRFWRPKRT